MASGELLVVVVRSSAMSEDKNKSKNRNDWHTQETYKGLHQLAIGALRFGAIANGGAAIALLALLGDLYSDGAEVSSLRSAMECFVAGIALAGLANVTAYLTNLALYQEEAHNKAGIGIFGHSVFLWISALLVLASIALFCGGALQATKVISGGC